MSFLPHAPSSSGAWFGSLAISTIAHASIGSFVLFSGAVVFLREVEDVDLRESSFDVSLEILDVSSIDESVPIEDIPEDAIAVIPDELEAEIPEDTFAALTPDEDILAPEPDVEELAEIAPDELTPEVDTAEVTEPEPIEPEVTEPETVEPEIIEPEPVEPEVTEPEIADILPEPESIQVPSEQEPIEEVVEDVVAEIQPIEPEPVVEQPIAIDNLSPIDSSVLSPLAEEGGAGPLEPAEGTSNDLALLLPEPEAVPPVNLPQVEEVTPTVLPEPEVPEVVEPEEVEPEVVAEEVDSGGPDATEESEIAEETVKRQPLANPTASDIAIGQLLRRIRAIPQEQCTLALPRRAGGAAGAGVSLIGADAEQLDAIGVRIREGLDFQPTLASEVIDLRQCATLDAIRQSESYPANRIGLSLESTTLESGDSLRGRVIGAGGLFLTMLLVDDNGVVQNLAPFVRMEDATPVFEAPVARSGPARTTRQMLVVMGTKGAPIDVSGQIGREAQDLFALIPSEALENMLFGVATFDLR